MNDAARKNGSSPAKAPAHKRTGQPIRVKPRALALGLGAAALAVVATGLWLWRGAPEPAPAPEGASADKPPTAWYLTQRPPSILVTATGGAGRPDEKPGADNAAGSLGFGAPAPGRPIFPDDEEAKNRGRAYEEALAREVRRTYVPARPGRGATLDARGDSPARAVPPVPLDPSLPPWRRYAVAPPDALGKPRVVVVIDDMGIDRARSGIAARLPGPLTLSFLTYANDLPEQTRDARARGHELMLHVAMEPNDKSIDPGPNVLLVGQSAAELRKSLEWGLGRFEGYVGVNNHMGSRFTRDAAGMTVVMGELAKRGLLFLDSRTSGHTVAAALAQRHQVPFEERNVFLDAEDRPGEAEARLKELEALARSHGHAIAIGHPKEQTLGALATWLPTLAGKGLVLSPLSSVVRAPEETRAAKR